MPIERRVDDLIAGGMRWALFLVQWLVNTGAKGLRLHDRDAWSVSLHQISKIAFAKARRRRRKNNGNQIA